MAKKEFAWDSEKIIGEVMHGDKVKFEVKRCMLDEKAYISITKWVLYSVGWSFPKNMTIPAETFTGIVNLDSWLN